MPDGARALRHVAQPLRALWHTARFRLWAARLDLELRRKGGRLILDAPHGARLETLPRIRARRAGTGDGTLTLKIGKGVTVGRELVIEVWAGGTNVLEIGDVSVFGDRALIQLFGGAIRLSDHVQVRTHSMVKSAGDLRIAHKGIVGISTFVHCTESIVLEELVGLAERVTIIDSDHLVDGSDEYFLDRPVLVGPVSIGRNAFIGTGAVVTRGSVIGRNSVVAAGAVVTAGTYPDGWLVGGVPAKPIKALG